jgi:hypothetical protein
MNQKQTFSPPTGSADDHKHSEDPRDAADQEKRVNNVILFRAPESTKESRKEREIEDIKLINSVLDEIGADNIDIKDPIRLGNRRDPNRCRPLRFTVSTNLEKDKIMSLARNLREAPESLRDLVIGHDLTQAQRDEKKKLYDEASKEIQEGFRVLVRSHPGPRWDPKVVKLRAKNSQAKEGEGVNSRL